MSCNHNVLDMDRHFVIDPVTRVISNDSGKVTLVQRDHNSEQFTFELPRMIEGHDMSLCNDVKIHYLNVDPITKESHADIYKVDDIQISDNDGEVVVFSWTIEGGATQYAGSLNFAICFACTDSEGKLEYAWNTIPYRNITVSSGIYNSDIILKEYTDILALWEAKISNLKDGKSAYDIWLELGNIGSETDFVNSLKGANGDTPRIQNGNWWIGEYDTGVSVVGTSDSGGGSVESGVSSPESFGAVGDGVTDDAASITQALASSKYVVFDGTKTYAVGSTIVIPADSHVDFRGATIRPKGNHDVIQVKPGSFIENLVVKCTGISGWDKSAMVFYGGDGFRASNPTRIINVKLYNDTNYNDGISNVGNGLYLYVDNSNQFVEGLSVTDLLTSGFGKGVYIKGLDQDIQTTSTKVSFIGANNFDKYWSFKDSYGIYIETRHELDRITTNFFTDMNIQSDTYGGFIYAIYCEGFENYFGGQIYDCFYLNKNDPNKAVFLSARSNRNVIEITAGTVLEYGWVTDLGTNNRVICRPYENTIQIPNDSKSIGMLGNQDDVFAFADKYMDCTLESLDGEPLYGNLSCIFDPNPKKILVYSEPLEGTSEKKARITINLKKAANEIPTFVLKFSRKFAPSKIKVTFYGDKEVKTIYDAADNVNDTVIISHVVSNRHMFYGDPVKNVAKIVIELGGFSCTEWADIVAVGRKEWALERIMAVTTNSTGNTWLRKDGGELYGNLKFSENFAPIIVGDDGKKYKITVSAEGALVPVEYTEAEEETPEVAALIPTMSPRATWYNTELAGAEPSTITNVTFDTTYVPTGDEDARWSCDKDNGAYIMAYRIGTDVIITPTTGSEYIRLNTDSSYMFANDGTNANFASLASVTGTEVLIADNQTDMNRVCAGNQVITTPISIPTGVISIAYGFQNCKALTVPPVLPEGLQSMLTSFSGCTGLQYLPEIPNTVTNMNYAFLTCKEATKAPSVIPAKVSSMEATFRNCSKIEGTIEINAINITKYTQCFDNAGKDGNGIVLTGTNTQLAELAATNTQGKVTVANA